MRVKKKPVWLLLIVCGIVLIATILFLINDTPEMTAERFAKRCGPVWDAAYETMATWRNSVSRGETMPDPVRSIFDIDRSLESISISYDGAARFTFDWHNAGPEKSRYVYWQKNDDYWQTHAVAWLLPSSERYNEQIQAEENENSLKLTGFGAGKKGYLIITRLCPCWFFSEEYNPT